ncbi:MAG: RidA family protein [Actinomycetota bacterium]|nr:RidA family protein [Actinomycetota bacterium]
MEAVVPTPQDWQVQYQQYHVSPAIRAGDHLYCCGVTGWDRDIGRAPTDPEAQFDRAFRNVAEVLEAASAGWADVVKAVSFHVGGLQEHIPTFVRVRDRYISEPYPVWTAAVVTELPDPTAIVEIEVTALIGQ